MAEKRLIDAAFPDRSAGRWCARCEQHGSHHTARHDDLLMAAVDRDTPTDGA